MHVRSYAIAIGLAGIVLGLGAPDAHAQAERTWHVEHKIVGKKGGASKDVSGIACVVAKRFPRPCLVIDDNLQDAQLVTVKDGEIVAGRSIALIDDRYEGKPLELDGEGVAYDDGYYYVIGSHGHPRDKSGQLDPVADAALIKARIAASSQIVRIRVDPDRGRPLSPSGAKAGAPDIARTAKLKPLLAAQPALAPFVDQRLENNGITIEGVAVRGGRLFAGFRGPVLSDATGDRAAILSASLDALFGTGAADARLYRLPLGQGRGVRDLTVFGDGLLILAGPMADSGGGTYAVYGWDAVGEAVKLLKDLPAYSADANAPKPEAILPLDATADALRVLVLFDGAKEGAPRVVEVARP